VLKGKYNVNNICTGLVEVMVLSRECKDAGKGMQNFEYMPALDEFAHHCAITTPEAYKLLQKTFQLYSLHSLQYAIIFIPMKPHSSNHRVQQSHMPCFLTSICE
jgi:hypothetical protein